MRSISLFSVDSLSVLGAERFFADRRHRHDHDCAKDSDDGFGDHIHRVVDQRVDPGQCIAGKLAQDSGAGVGRETALGKIPFRVGAEQQRARNQMDQVTADTGYKSPSPTQTNGFLILFLNSGATPMTA